MVSFEVETGEEEIGWCDGYENEDDSYILEELWMLLIGENKVDFKGDDYEEDSQGNHMCLVDHWLE